MVDDPLRRFIVLIDQSGGVEEMSLGCCPQFVKGTSFNFKGLLSPNCQRMEKFRGAGVMCRATMVSIIFLLSCSFLQLARAQANQSNILLNIACGSNQNYTDPVTGLTWVPDTPYITTGKVHTNLGAPSSPPNASGMSSLRYFDDQRPKNCYSLPVDGNSPAYYYYMIRASFFYGNYDQNAQPPSFQLAMDGNIVANITMTDSSSGQYVEFQYVPFVTNTLLLCLIRTSRLSTPFISGITLIQVTDYFTVSSREYFRDTLSSGYIMKTITRVNFGGTDLVRYPSDSHDYMWYPEGANSALLKLTTSSIEALSTTDTINVNDIPPPVFQTAVTTSGRSLTSYLVLQSSGEVGWPNIEFLSQYQWLSLFWAELNSSTSNMTREFNLTVPAHPDWAGFSDLGSYLSTAGYNVGDLNCTTSGLNDTFTLTNTNGSASSTLGPILNGMEFFSQSDPRMLMTSTQDVLEIESIEGILNLTEWTGDPCVPYPHTWLTCATSDGTQVSPDIIALNLSGYQLEGTISPIAPYITNLTQLTSLSLANNNLVGGIPDLSYMTNLITLDLSNNSLNGTIPFWLTNLQNLRHLYLERNNLNGPIPSELLQSDTLDFKYFPGNAGLTGGVPLPSTSSESRNLAILGATLGSGLGLVLLANLACCLYPWLKVQIPKVFKGNNPEIGRARGAKLYSLAEVTAMTRNFNSEIGKGGFGPVYYGKLPDGQEVAVKVADGSSRQGKREFFNEVDVLSRVRHKNLVALVGYCQEDGQQILIYEYMKNGSLHDQLFGDKVNSLGKLLDWRMRLKIGLDAAQGLEYLHTGCSPSFIHRDVKSSNILLSAKFDAKVADFGLTKLMGESDGTKVLTLVMGTPGYVDPEYYNTHYLSTKSDIYSFGVVLLELITGRPPINRAMSDSASGESTNLCNWVRAGLEDGNLDTILDPAVRASAPTPNQDALWKVTEIALQCVEPKSIHRPTMTTVLQELHVAYNLEDPASSVQAQEESFGPFDYSGSELGPLAR